MARYHAVENKGRLRPIRDIGEGVTVIVRARWDLTQAEQRVAFMRAVLGLLRNLESSADQKPATVQGIGKFNP
jgi:hypothetical protein